MEWRGLWPVRGPWRREGWGQCKADGRVFVRALWSGRCRGCTKLGSCATKARLQQTLYMRGCTIGQLEV